MKFFRIIIFLFFLAVGWQTSVACDCGSIDDTVLANFGRADFVVIAKAISVEEGEKIENYYSGGEKFSKTTTVVNSTKMLIEKVYKGNLKAGDEMIFGQGEARADCLLYFDKEAVGKTFLLYLDSKDKKVKLWFVNMCSRSTNVPADSYRWTGNAADDLLFLNRMDEVRGKTRISGSVFAYITSPFKGETNSYKKFACLKVRISGGGETYETETDENGVYEIYDLPAGSYMIQPIVPQNWKIDVWGGYSTSSGNRWEHENLWVTLKPQKHAYYNFHLKLNNKISGRVLDRTGNPIENVCPQLIPAQGEPRDDFVRSRTNCTKKDGSFEIKEIPAGNYKIVVNLENEISSRTPFNTIYYPRAKQFEKASVITIAEAEDKEEIDIHVLETRETITLTGVFLSSDGVPVVRGFVRFIADEAGKNIDGDAADMTDENGRFSIKILKCLKGKLSGSVTLDANQFIDCPQVIKLINENGEIDRQDKISNIIEFEANKNFEGVEVKLPFPSCNKRKIISRNRID